MNNHRVKILDCTLRDGGRCFGNAWGDENISAIAGKLDNTGIEYIEIGFLWYISDGICRRNTTLFNSMKEIDSFIPDERSAEYVVYIEYQVYKEGRGQYFIPECKDTKIDGIRLGILKSEINEAEETMREIIKKGYKLFVQPINILSYKESELVYLINVVNRVPPFAFAIVDTYGSMYLEDLELIYKKVDTILNKSILVGFHSHNNIQMSLALATLLIDISKERHIILDGTLGGVGMGAGNLNTELIAKYINHTQQQRYNMPQIIRLIDQYISKIKESCISEPSIITYEAALNWNTQIDTSYILNQYEYLSLEEKRMLQKFLKIGGGTAKKEINKYIENFEEYRFTENNIQRLNDCIKSRQVLVIGKGNSVLEKTDKIKKYIKENKPTLIFVNSTNLELFSDMPVEKFYFYSNRNPYNSIKSFKEQIKKRTIVLSSVVGFEEDHAEYVFSNEEIFWNDIIAKDGVIMILNLLEKIDAVKEVLLVGVDGGNVTEKHVEIYKGYFNSYKHVKISFLTHSKYE